MAALNLLVAACHFHVSAMPGPLTVIVAWSGPSGVSVTFTSLCHGSTTQANHAAVPSALAWSCCQFISLL